MRAMSAVQPLNYCTKAIEQFRSNTINRSFPMSAEGVAYLTAKLEAAQKFILPDGGRLLDPDSTRPEVPGTIFRPPFPVVALEYAMVNEDRRDADSIYTCSPAPKRIVLAWVWENDLPHSFGVAGFAPAAGSGVALTEISFRADAGIWMPNPGATFTPFDCQWSTSTTIAPYLQDRIDKGYVSAAKAAKAKVHDVTFIPLLPELLNHSGRLRGGLDGAIDLAMSDMHHESIAYFDLCCALACSNVSTERFAAPKRLNEKRVKKGKAPLFDFHILKVAGGAMGGDHLGGGGTGVRAHLRRGHIRRLRHLGPDRITWVNAAMVRGRGEAFVEKAYDMRGAAA